MEKEKSINEEIHRFQLLGEAAVPVEKKLEELIELLENSNLDSESVLKLKDRFNDAIENKYITKHDLEVFSALDQNNLSRIERAESLENLLYEYRVDSKVSKRYLLTEKITRISVMFIALLLIVLGFAMIIMPAPPYFEMFTIYHFTTDDGITLMDLISLIIVFVGVYLLLTSITKFNRQKQYDAQ